MYVPITDFLFMSLHELTQTLSGKDVLSSDLKLRVLCLDCNNSKTSFFSWAKYFNKRMKVATQFYKDQTLINYFKVLYVYYAVYVTVFVDVRCFFFFLACGYKS